METHPTDQCAPLELLEKRPKYKRKGLARWRYAGFFLFDTVLIFLLGALLCFIATGLFGSVNVVLGWLMIFVTQVLGHIILWIYLSKSFRWHEVRKWHFHLGLQLWFSYFFQFGFLAPVWSKIEQSMMDYVSGEFSIGWLITLAVVLSIPLFVSKIGLWVSIHSAIRVHYEGMGFGREYRMFFHPQTGKDVARALATRDRSLIDQLKLTPSPIEERRIFGSYAALTLTLPPEGKEGPAYLHLKDVWMGGAKIFSKNIHRALGFSRLHHVKLNENDMAALKELLPELFDPKSRI